MQKIQILLFGTVWIFLNNIFHPWLVETTNEEPTDTEGQLCVAEVSHVILHFTFNIKQYCIDNAIITPLSSLDVTNPNKVK